MFEAALVVPAAMAVGDFARSSRNVVRARHLRKVVFQVGWRTQGDIHRDVRTRRKVVIDLSPIWGAGRPRWRRYHPLGRCVQAGSGFGRLRMDYRRANSGGRRSPLIPI